MRVRIVGAGYVGLCTAASLAYLGHEVTCVDVDPEKIAGLVRGELPIYEPHLAELLAVAPIPVRFAVPDDANAASAGPPELVFIAVGTPPGADGSPDLKQVAAAVRTITQSLGDGLTVVVNKSTVPVGSGNWVGSLIDDAQPPGARTATVVVASNPEFLREGSALMDSLYPDRIVVGSDDARAIEALVRLYQPLIEQDFAPPPFLPRPARTGRVPLVTTDLASAELIKYASNAFLALKISFINQIAELSERVGADIESVSRALGLDARIGSAFLQAGLGWGGSCFGKDTAALVATAHEYGLSMSIVEAAREVNYHQRARIVERLLAELKIMKGRTIGLLGLAFKPQTDDLRDAPSVDIARRLLARGAKVRVHDPVALPRARRELADVAFELCDTVDSVFRGADAVVLVTEWPEYAQLDWARCAKAMRTPLLLDGRNALPRDALTAAGLRYFAVGR